MKRLIVLVLAVVAAGFLTEGLAGQKSVNQPNVADTGSVLNLVRTLNTVQATFFLDTHSYAPREAMLGEKGLKQQAPKSDWAKQINYSSDEILPGWRLDFALAPDGYRLVLIGPKDVFISDESAVIYRAALGQTRPGASTLKSARSFPGAVPFDEFQDSKR